jgi:LPXTG-motif cell wall-anchored protein
LLTATAAGTLLGALWFVPSANASQDELAQHSSTSTSRSSTDSTRASYASHSSDSSTVADVTRTSVDSAGDGARLADTGGIDTTPYVVGGTLFLGLGAGFVAYSVRRERATAY